MKTLKRSLSLVLAIVLVVSLLGIAASAKSLNDYTDKADVRYEVPVGVLTGMGILNGYTDSSFDPLSNVTRAEAAKAVCFAILGPNGAQALSNSAYACTYTDMAGHWADVYVEYLTKQGIVNGRGDGSFDPNSNVTAYEMAKMLLCAVGYGKQGEFVGVNWQLNVAKLAIGTILTGNVDASTINYGNPATRDETALYIYNAMTGLKLQQYIAAQEIYLPLDNQSIGSKVFKFDPKGIVYGSDSATVDTGIVRANAATSTALQATNTVPAQTQLVNSLQNFGLGLNDSKNDKIARTYSFDSGLDLILHDVSVYRNLDNTVVYYVKDNTTVTNFSSELATNLSLKDLQSKLDSRVTAGTIFTYNYGQDANWTTWGQYSGNEDGQPIQLLSYDGGKTIAVADQMRYAFVYVSGVTSKAYTIDHGVTSTGLPVTDTIAPKNVTFSGTPSKGYYIAQFVSIGGDQSVGLNGATGTGIVNVTAAATVTGTYSYRSAPQSNVRGATYTVGGTGYQAVVAGTSGVYTENWTNLYFGDNLGNKDLSSGKVDSNDKPADQSLTLFLAPNGKIVAYAENTVSSDLVCLVQVGWQPATAAFQNGSLQGDVYFTDGTHRVIAIDQKDSDSLIAGVLPASAVPGNVCNNWKVDGGVLGLYNLIDQGDGTYALVAVKADGTATGKINQLQPGIAHVNDKTGADALFANSGSVFFYVSGDVNKDYTAGKVSVTVKTGIANALTPAKTDASTESYYNILPSGNYVTAALFGPSASAPDNTIYYYNGKYVDNVKLQTYDATVYALDGTQSIVSLTNPAHVTNAEVGFYTVSVDGAFVPVSTPTPNNYQIIVDQKVANVASPTDSNQIWLQMEKDVNASSGFVVGADTKIVDLTGNSITDVATLTDAINNNAAVNLSIYGTFTAGNNYNVASTIYVVGVTA